jgi:hypothetical protein
LHEKGHNVTTDEDLGEPSCSDGSKSFAVCEMNESAERHVDACGEEGRSDEQEKRLHDVDAEGILMAVCQSTTNIADAFDYWEFKQGFDRVQDWHLQKPPMIKGVKNLLRCFAAWKTCKPVVVENRMRKTTAATREGW